MRNNLYNLKLLGIFVISFILYCILRFMIVEIDFNKNNIPDNKKINCDFSKDYTMIGNCLLSDGNSVSYEQAKELGYINGPQYTNLESKSSMASAKLQVEYNNYIKSGKFNDDKDNYYNSLLGAGIISQN